MNGTDISKEYTELLTEEEYKNIRKILTRFLESYKKKPEDLSDEEWLNKKLKAELPEKSEKELKEYSREIIGSTRQYDKDYKELNEACKNGVPKEKWFADKAEAATQGVSIIQYGHYFDGIDRTLQQGNELMHQAITTKNGNISQCMNLDGFIAEQQHVNIFNANAALENSPYRAEVCVPKQGKTYGKNSFDVIIKDIRTGKRVNQYQLKYGKTAEDTIKLLKNGNYNNQRFIVPEEQLEVVRKAFPDKTVESFIGGNTLTPIQSEGISKTAVKEMQENVQAGQGMPVTDYNSLGVKKLAFKVGGEAASAGIQSAILTSLFVMAQKRRHEKIEADEVLEAALKSGTDTGIKAAISGGIKVGAEKGIIKIIPKGTPAGNIATAVCVGVENIKIFAKVATGELTLAEAAERMGRTSVAMVSGLTCSAGGMAVGAAALSWIPVIGPVVGGLAGGIIGYSAGSGFGEKVFEGAKKVVKSAARLSQRAIDGVKAIGSKIKDGFRSIFS